MDRDWDTDETATRNLSIGTDASQTRPSTCIDDFDCVRSMNLLARPENLVVNNVLSVLHRALADLAHERLVRESEFG